MFLLFQANKFNIFLFPYTLLQQYFSVFSNATRELKIAGLKLCVSYTWLFYSLLSSTRIFSIGFRKAIVANIWL
jgi:hypothetical protein